jgi:hypothetical protein
MTGIRYSLVFSILDSSFQTMVEDSVEKRATLWIASNATCYPQVFINQLSIFASILIFSRIEI